MVTRDRLIKEAMAMFDGNPLPKRHKYKDVTDQDVEELGVENPVGSVKYDGANYFLHLDRQGRPSYLSRKLSVRGEPIIRTDRVPHLADFELGPRGPRTYNLELYHSGKELGGPQKHSVATGILNSLPPKAIARQEELGPLRAAVFDVMDESIPTYADKLEAIQRLVERVGKPDVFHTVETAEGIPAIRALDRRTQEEGLEGLIVTSLTTPESENIRYKTKHYGTHNLLVSGVTQEHDKDGKPKDAAGALIVVDATGREVANVGTGLSRALREEIWANQDDWINKKLIQVKGYPTTKHRIRSPVYNGEGDGDLDTL